ncbi:MAG: condensation domain-containing protein, partial [Actinomycetota bacterium]
RKWMRGFTSPGALQPLHRTAQSAAGNRQVFCEHELRLTEPETTQLKEFAKRHHLTLSSVMYGLWALVLSSIDGRNDLVFGIVVSGRHVPLPRVDEMVGVFINTLPVRATVRPDALLSEWLKELQEQRSEATQFEHTPLSLVQSWSEVPRGTALFDSIVVFENYPAVDWDTIARELRIESIRSFERSNYPLTLWILPGRQLSLKVGYDSGVLNRAKVTALLGNFGALLASISDQTISELGQQLLSTAAHPEMNQVQLVRPECLDQEPPLAAIGAIAAKEQQPAERSRNEGEKFE